LLIAARKIMDLSFARDVIADYNSQQSNVSITELKLFLGELSQ
jgi:hypothetical protein